MAHEFPLEQNQYLANRKYAIGRTKLTSGIEGEAYDVSYQSPLYVTTEPFQLSISRGLLPPGSNVVAFGQNPAIGATREDLWAFGGIYPWLTAASALRFVSTSVNDDATGSGARTGLLTGLDANYDLQTETITLDGTTNVDTITTWLRVLHFEIITVGAGEETAGNISITAVTGGNQLGYIVAGHNETRLSQYTVPNGKTGYIYQVFFNSFANTTKVATVRIQCRLFLSGELTPWITMGELDLSNGHAIIELPFIILPGKSDLRMDAISDAAATRISGGTFLSVIDDE